MISCKTYNVCRLTQLVQIIHKISFKFMSFIKFSLKMHFNPCFYKCQPIMIIQACASEVDLIE